MPACKVCKAMLSHGTYCEEHIPRLTTGEPSTLGIWYKLTKAFFGEDSKATAFIKEKLDAQGENEYVVSDEGQLLYALISIHNGE